MSIFEIIIIAVGLSLDSFALAITSGMVHRANLFRHTLKLSSFFAIFQMTMPLIGWIAGIQLKPFIEGIDHWIAFVLLFAIGIKMIIDTFQKQPKDNCVSECSIRMLCGMAVATSIDALVIGISFAFIQINILFSVITIGVMTFLFASIGVFLGRKIGVLFGKIAT
ncbi:manganese efflux pump MntP family protein, partial [Patescibacteria group bacterium]|nr:manganese efflux pump MntP family protein [Patescibacteria group bacterium]